MIAFLLHILLLSDIVLTKVIDTLSTHIPGVKVVLYEDNTWRYLREKNIAEIIEASGWDSAPLLLAEDSLHYCIPAMGRFCSSFGHRFGRNHTGVDIALNLGTPVRSAFDGTVLHSNFREGYGLTVTIIHWNGLETLYAHLSRLNVSSGDYVLAGDIIGYSGNTGRSTGPHLHFETRFKGYPFDPERIFDFSSGKLLGKIFTVKKSFLCISNNYSKNLNKDLFERTPGKSAKRETIEHVKVSVEEGVPVYHTITNGDNLSRLAKKYGTTVREICRLNENITPETVLQLGWKVRVK